MIKITRKAWAREIGREGGGEGRKADCANGWSGNWGRLRSESKKEVALMTCRKKDTMAYKLDI